MEKNITKVFKINLDGNTLDQYENLLSKFNNWKEYNREIKLNSLLDEKKIEFTLDITSHSFGVMYINLVEDENDYLLLKKASSVVKFMKFILKENKVLDLEVTIKTLDTAYGKILKNLIQSGKELELKQVIIDNQVRSFYFKP